MQSAVELTGDVGDDAAETKNQFIKCHLNRSKWQFSLPFEKKHLLQFQEFLQNAKVRPLVGESVLVRGAIIVFGSPIKYEGKKLLVFAAEGLDGLPRVIGSIAS